MFQKCIDIYNFNRGENTLMTTKILAEKFAKAGLCASYEYAKKMIISVDSGKQKRVNLEILQATSEICGVSMNELFNLNP